MRKVSHREFTKIKNSFNPKTIYYYSSSAPVKRTPDDDWNSLTWRFRGESDDLFKVINYGDGREKEYYVSDWAYKVLRILKLCDIKFQNTFNNIS